jgi:hypothetical protein
MKKTTKYVDHDVHKDTNVVAVADVGRTRAGTRQPGEGARSKGSAD